MAAETVARFVGRGSSTPMRSSRACRLISSMTCLHSSRVAYPLPLCLVRRPDASKVEISYRQTFAP